MAVFTETDFALFSTIGKGVVIFSCILTGFNTRAIITAGSCPAALCARLVATVLFSAESGVEPATMGLFSVAVCVEPATTGLFSVAIGVAPGLFSMVL